MPVPVQPTATIPQLRALLEVGRLVRDERDLEALFDRVAGTIAEALGFSTVAINAHRPAWDDFEVVTVHGREGARAMLLGNTTDRDSWRPYLDDRFRRRGAYLVRHDQIDWVDPNPVWVPDLQPSDDPEAWHPDDALIVVLERSDGEILGFISVDEPVSGRVPGDDELDLLVALAGHVAAAIESAQNAFLAQRHREALATLLEISTQLAAAESVDAVLTGVAHGISSALGFERVAVLVRDASGRFTPRAAAGWAPGDPALDIAFRDDELDVLFVPEHEVEGCVLLEHTVAESLVSSGSHYNSTRNGQGPRGWYRHWLLVPLVERDGSRRGFIWADDPADCLLPSAERLQALRTFANQATMALRSALDFETLNRRNGELAALHETTFALLEHREHAGVLEVIVDNARRLANTEHAYLYLVDRELDRLRLAVGLGYFAEIEAPLLARGEGASGRAWAEVKPFVIDDYFTWAGGVEAFKSFRMHATTGVPLLAGGEVIGVLGLVSDDPDRRFADAEVALLERFAQLAALALENARLYSALEQSEVLHRGIVEGSTDIICLVDLEGRLEVMSPSSLATLGRTPAEMIGRPFSEFVHPEDLDAAMVAFEEAIRGSASMTVRALHADGSTVVLEVTASAIRGADGRPTHVLATVRDVTERRALEEQLRQAQKMESIGRLAGGVAHDFNNLLTGIRGYAELLLLDFDGGGVPSRESVEQIARAADRAASLTGQLLAFSRKQVLRPQLIDLNEVVEGMANMLSRMLGEDVVLTTALDRELGRTLADPTQLEQVVLNLALNARDAMPDGGTLVIRTANLAHDDGHRVALVVADTGEGMDAETKGRIFEPFFTTKAVGEGTGLGLATVHGIVAQSGGSIDVESAPGVGTTFTVCLPRAA